MNSEKLTEAQILQALHQWMLTAGTDTLPHPITLDIGGECPVEVTADEVGYSLEILFTLPDEEGEGDEENAMYHCDTLEQVATMASWWAN
jgi:hypothetical protein